MTAPVSRCLPKLPNVSRVHFASTSSAVAAAAAGTPGSTAANAAAGSHKVSNTAKLSPHVSTITHKDNSHGALSMNSGSNGARPVSSKARSGASGSPAMIMPTSSVALSQGLGSAGSLGLTHPPKPRDSDTRALTEGTGASQNRPLDKLPAASLWRSFANHVVMTQPLLLSVATSAFVKRNLGRFSRNPVARLALDNIFYPQFCAGATDAEIQRTFSQLRDLGYKGVILSYAREIEIDHGESASDTNASKRTAAHVKHVADWLAGTLQTIRYSSPEDFVAVKFSGAGPECVRMLENAEKPDEVMGQALSEICQLSRDRGVRIMIDAEHYSQQRGIDKWTMDLMKKSNHDGITVYNTYQMSVRPFPWCMLCFLHSKNQYTDK